MQFQLLVILYSTFIKASPIGQIIIVTEGDRIVLKCSNDSEPLSVSWTKKNHKDYVTLYHYVPSKNIYGITKSFQSKWHEMKNSTFDIVNNNVERKILFID